MAHGASAPSLRVTLLCEKVQHPNSQEREIASRLENSEINSEFS
jgi:hypothetical protein